MGREIRTIYGDGALCSYMSAMQINPLINTMLLIAIRLSNEKAYNGPCRETCRLISITFRVDYDTWPIRCHKIVRGDNEI